MFVGHYAVGLALKKADRDIPLWLIFISVQLVDILAFTLVLLGIERISYNPTANPFLRTTIEYVPYSHSLLADAILAGMVLLFFWKFMGKTWGGVLGAGILSHWFMDVLVHRPDMPLFRDSFKVGLGLWKSPRFAFIMELSLLIVAGAWLLRDYPNRNRLFVMLALMTLGFSGMFFAPQAEATPAVASLTSLSLYTFFTLMAFWCERRTDKLQKTGSH